MTEIVVEGTAKTAVMTETVVVVYRRGCWFISSTSEVRILWHITLTLSPIPKSLRIFTNAAARFNPEQDQEAWQQGHCPALSGL
jgi:hypothetical protein